MFVYHTLHPHPDEMTETQHTTMWLIYMVYIIFSEVRSTNAPHTQRTIGQPKTLTYRQYLTSSTPQQPHPHEHAYCLTKTHTKRVSALMALNVTHNIASKPDRRQLDDRTSSSSLEVLIIRVVVGSLRRRVVIDSVIIIQIVLLILLLITLVHDQQPFVVCRTSLPRG